MCTVSFVSSNGKVILTSNRDEKIIRPSAIEPKNYLINNRNVVFPKDAKAGGTWFAITENANVAILLNGAAEKHNLKPAYRKSRGLILLDIIAANCAIEKWETIDLFEIEPFTIVLFNKNKLFQLRWNEFNKEKIELDVSQKHIWSSSTLYQKEIREQRSNWFYKYLDAKNQISAEDMIHFHRYAENEDNQNGLVINRNDLLKTLSITQTVIERNKVDILYFDLIQEKKSENNFIII